MSRNDRSKTAPDLVRFGPIWSGAASEKSCSEGASGPTPNAAGDPKDVSMASQTPSNYYYYSYYFYCYYCYYYYDYYYYYYCYDY